MVVFRASMFRVVSFHDATEVAVISDRWWQTASGHEGAERPLGFTYWPPRTAGRIDQLLKNGGRAPDPDTWSRHPARSLLKTG